MNNRILVADDEVDVLQLVGSKLRHAGYEVSQAEDGPTALSRARTEFPTLLVLDIMMPGMTGLEVTRALKRDLKTAAISIILLSARSEEVDRVLGFELGVDDFVTKPFSPRELVLRVHSILRRKALAVPATGQLQFGEISLDQEKHAVTVRGAAAELTAIEFKLLLALMKMAGRVLSRDELLNRVWGCETAIELRTVDTHLRRLREKLGLAGAQIQTIRGFGYRLDAE